MKDKNDTSLHVVNGIPDDCSILREVQIYQRSSTPPPDNQVREPDPFGVWSTSQDGPEVAPPAIRKWRVLMCSINESCIV